MAETVDELVAIEWEMFYAVNAEGGPRADCQNHPDTFDIMRRAQYAAWSEDAQQSYLGDLKAARAAGRNLVIEKYARMMESTAPDEYAAIAGLLPPVDDEARELAEQITGLLAEENRLFRLKYPGIVKGGRPAESGEDTEDATSIETYQRSELLTYSTDTLRKLLACLQEREEQGGETGFVDRIYEYTVMRYGYASLDDAEHAMVKQYAESLLNSGYANCSCKLGYCGPTGEDGCCNG